MLALVISQLEALLTAHGPCVSHRYLLDEIPTSHLNVLKSANDDLERVEVLKALRECYIWPGGRWRCTVRFITKSPLHE